MSKYKKIIISVMAFFSVGIFLYLSFYKHDFFNVTISPDEHLLLQQATPALSKVMNKNQVNFYLANFNGTQVPDIKTTQHTNILWLGSHKHFDIHKVKDFDVVLSSTPDLSIFLQNSGIKNDIHPLFIDETSGLSSPAKCVINPNTSDCYYVVIGEQQLVLTVLQDKKLNYKSYPSINNELAVKLEQDKEHISGIITNNTSYSNESLDVNPFYLWAINNLIPILSDNTYYWNTEQKNIFISLLFADTVAYYTYKSDVEDFFNCLPCRLKNAQKAKFLVSKIYSVAALDKHIHDIIEKRVYEPHLKDVMTIVSPTYAGIYNNGDYWIAKDLEESFRQNFNEVLTVFPLSQITYIGDTYLYIRGGLPLVENKILPNSISLYYLLFPSFANENTINNSEEFMQRIQDEIKNVDAVAVASQNIADDLKKNNINAYYIPQFTNKNKFYPDYDEEKKADVLFVGNYLPYRVAVPIVIKAGLPITIYGNGWKEGMAKAEYIDNKILRKYYSSAKIVLNDTRPDMRQLGFISNRIFDATACGTLVISDYMKEIEDIYGDSVPMWKTEEELIELVKYYLDPEHEAERKEKAERAREITLKNFTADIAAQKFMDIIKHIKREKSIP